MQRTPIKSRTNLVENYVYAGLGFNFFDAIIPGVPGTEYVSTITSHSFVTPITSIILIIFIFHFQFHSIPFFLTQNNFNEYFNTTNGSPKLLKVREVMSVLRSIVKNKQEKVPAELITPIVRMEDSPTFYFNTYMLFKEMFFADNTVFDQKVSYCYSSNMERGAEVQAKWMIVLSLLKGRSDE